MSLTHELLEVNKRLFNECVAHEATKGKLAEARRLHAETVHQLEAARNNLQNMADALESIECVCEHEYDDEDYPRIEPLDEDPCFYACPASGVARNTAELMEMIEEEEEGYEHDEY